MNVYLNVDGMTKTEVIAKVLENVAGAEILIGPTHADVIITDKIGEALHYHDTYRNAIVFFLGDFPREKTPERMPEDRRLRRFQARQGADFYGAERLARIVKQIIHQKR